jgi:hypothetical protein
MPQLQPKQHCYTRIIRACVALTLQIAQKLQHKHLSVADLEGKLQEQYLQCKPSCLAGLGYSKGWQQLKAKLQAISQGHIVRCVHTDGCTAMSDKRYILYTVLNMVHAVAGSQL